MYTIWDDICLFKELDINIIYINVIIFSYSDYFSFFTAFCPDPGHPENGQTIGGVFAHDSDVEFECLGDRLLQGSSQAKCNNGKWDQALPTCRGNLITNDYN